MPFGDSQWFPKDAVPTFSIKNNLTGLQEGTFENLFESKKLEKKMDLAML